MVYVYLHAWVSVQTPRYTDGKREMTIGEIKHFFTNNTFSKKLLEIEAGIKELLQKGSSERKIEMINMLINEQISDLDVDDGKILAEASYKKFISCIGNEPFFRISILPINAKRDLIDVDTPEVTNLIKDPPNQRESGWNMDGSYAETERFSEGLFRKGILNDTLILKQNGFMEFFKKIDSTFCWNQTEDEFKKRPRLYPYPVIEYPLSFMKLYKLLISRFNKETSFIVTMGYFNIKGYVLYPGHPNSIEFNVPRNYISPYQKENLTVPLLVIDNNFSPDEVTLSLVKFVYNTFGYTDDRIPFYDKQRKQFQVL